MTNSIQTRLAAWLTGAILLVAVAATIFSYLSAYHEAIEMQDEQLRAVAALVRPLNRAPAVSDNGAEEEERISFGRIGADANGLPAELKGLPTTIKPGFHVQSLRGIEWRIFVAQTPRDRIIVAQPTAVRDDIAHDGAIRAVLPFLILIPILLLLVRDIIKRMFAPLRSLAGKVDARTDDELGAIDEIGLPVEIMPLVRATNRLLARVEDAMSSQRRFVADAAHELRTPLGALTLQAERLEAADMSDEARNRLASVRNGLERARILLEQLLALARMQESAGDPSAPTRLGPLLRSVITMLMPLAEARSVDLGVVGDTEVDVPLREFELSLLLRNLIENAIRHGRSGGKVDVIIDQSEGQTRIEVRDDGPGIPRRERDAVLQPFHRLNVDVDGSGLGLAIVKAIADRCRATIEVGDAEPGARIIVTLPRD